MTYHAIQYEILNIMYLFKLKLVKREPLNYTLVEIFTTLNFELMRICLLSN